MKKKKQVIYKTETESQTYKTNLWFHRESLEGGDKLGVWDWHIHTTKFKMDKQQGPTV